MLARLLVPSVLLALVTSCARVSPFENTNEPTIHAAIRELGDEHAPNSPASMLANPKAETSFVIWQLPAQGKKQMMSYVLLTEHRSVIVVDGGWSDSDADYLRAFLTILGSQVDAWFITHPHPDHVGALTKLLRDPQDLQIKKIYSSLNTLQWVKANEPSQLPAAVAFSHALAKSDFPQEDSDVGDVYDIDGVTIEILGIRNPEIANNAINNSSMVFRVADSSKSLLFLGDLGFEGGEKLLQGPYAARLPSDFVQMAHHGQNGVGEDVYQAIHPKYCLWPTPKWLWEDDSGGGEGSGRWLTLTVRGWMKTLGVDQDYPSFAGLKMIR